MTLYQLGEEYLCQARELGKQISEKEKKLACARGADVYELNRQLVCLHEMERETRITGQSLTGYYTNISEGRIYRPHKQPGYTF